MNKSIIKTVTIATYATAATYLTKKVIDAARREVEWYKDLPAFSVTDKEGREVKVKHMDTAHQGGVVLAKGGIIMAGCFQLPIMKGVAFLATDEYFDAMSKDDQAFLVNHELGHVAHQDFKTMRKAQIKARFSGKSSDEVVRATRNIDMECSADEYATEHIGYDKALHALKSMREFMENQISIAETSCQLDVILRLKVIRTNREAIKEVDKRIKNLQGKEAVA